MKSILPGALSSLVATIATSVFMTTHAVAVNGAEQGRCRARYEYLHRYEISGWKNRDTGVRLRTEVAKTMCDDGDTRRGNALLERELRRCLLPLPREK